MTSELRVDNLKGSTTGGSINVLGEGTSATTNLQQGLAKSWIDFNGTGTVSIDDSHNVSSADDDGTGDYGFNFTSNMSSTAYCPQATGRSDASGEGSWCAATRTPATTGCDVNYFNASGSAQDQTALSWSTLGDLA